MSKKTPGVLTAVKLGRGGVRVTHNKNTAETPHVPNRPPVSQDASVFVAVCAAPSPVGATTVSSKKGTIKISPNSIRFFGFLLH